MLKHPWSYPSLALPHISNADTPEGERNAVWNINTTLIEMEMYVAAFHAALSLFDFGREESRKASDRRDEKAHSLYSNWLHLAARDGAMTLYHFWRAMQSTSNFGEAPSLRSRVDSGILRECKKVFEQAFPAVIAMRHAVAHSAELTKSDATRRENAMDGSFSAPGVQLDAKGTIVKGLIAERTYQYTFMGKQVSYELSEDSMRRLSEIRNEWFRAFERT